MRSNTIGIGNLVKVVAWYDNEWGDEGRVADLLKFLGDKGLSALSTQKGARHPPRPFLFQRRASLPAAR